MESNEAIREEIFTIVNNQIEDNNPPETKRTFERLLSLGYDEFDAKILIGQCIAVEMFDIMKNNTKFNPERYDTNLKNLPVEPFEEE